MLRFLARFIAVVFALVFVVGAIPILFFQAAGTHLTGSQVYKDALTKERIYDRLPALVADTATQAVAADERAAANRGAAVEESLRCADVLVMAAAPADFRPRAVAGRMKV